MVVVFSLSEILGVSLVPKYEGLVVAMILEEDLRETFGSFEEVEGMQIHKDRKNEFKELKGRYLPNHPRPLKVSRGSWCVGKVKLISILDHNIEEEKSLWNLLFEHHPFLMFWILPYYMQL